MKKIIFLFITIMTMFFLNAFNLNAKLILSTNPKGDGENTILVTEDRLLSGYELINEHKELSFDANIEVLNIKFKHYDEYVVAGRKNYLPYIAYYKNGNLVFEKTMNENTRGRIVDMILHDDKIILLGEYRRDDNLNKIMILEMDYLGTISKKQEIISTNHIYVNKLVEIKNEYFFIGTTLSKEVDGCYNDSEQSILVGKVNKEKFSDYYIIIFGNKGKNILYDALVLNDNLYILASFKNIGYFNSGTSSLDFLALLKFDERLDMPEYISLIRDFVNPPKMTTFNEKIVLGGKKDSFKIKVLEFSEELEKSKEWQEEFFKIENGINDFILFGENNRLIIKGYENNSKEELISLNKNYERCDNYSRKIDFRYNINLFTVKHNFYNQFYQNDNSYYFETRALVKKTKDSVFVNGLIVPTEEIDTSGLFGEKIYYKKSYIDEIEIISEYKESTPLNVNIKPFGIYDRGVKLEFNADGYLNGKKIESGYIVNECDKYILELVGIDNKKESIYFTVEDLSIKDVKKEEFPDYRLDIFNAEAFIKEENQDIKNDLNKEVIETKNDWYYLPLAFFIGVGLAFVFYRRRGNA